MYLEASLCNGFNDVITLLTSLCQSMSAETIAYILTVTQSINTFITVFILITRTKNTYLVLKTGVFRRC